MNYERNNVSLEFLPGAPLLTSLNPINNGLFPSNQVGFVPPKM